MNTEKDPLPDMPLTDSGTTALELEQLKDAAKASKKSTRKGVGKKSAKKASKKSRATMAKKSKKKSAVSKLYAKAKVTACVTSQQRDAQNRRMRANEKIGKHAGAAAAGLAIFYNVLPARNDATRGSGASVTPATARAASKADTSRKRMDVSA